MTLSLSDLGWTTEREAEFQSVAGGDLVPGRICRQQSGRTYAWTEAGEVEAVLSGRLENIAASAAELPAIGDWVALLPLPGEEKAVVQVLLTRTTCFSRKSAGGRTTEQVIAANIDTLFLVSGLDDELNIRRIERYLLLARESGAEPVVVLNKSDLRGDAEEIAGKVRAIAPALDFILTSASDGSGMERLAPHLGPGRTVALLGSSGVGKSSLINRLAGGEVARTGEVREKDSRGRHVTSHREMVFLPSGVILIDTPGMREVAIWVSEEGIAAAYPEIDELSERCKFRDCAHETEPGCAVLDAVESGDLNAARLESYHRLRKEFLDLQTRQGEQERKNVKRRWKPISKSLKKYYDRREKPRGH